MTSCFDCIVNRANTYPVAVIHFSRMSIDPDVVEDIITEAQEEYLDRTIIKEDLLREPKTRTDHECLEEYGLEPDQFNNANHSYLITQNVSDVVDCETRTFIEYLAAESGDNHQIGNNQFYMDLLEAADEMLSPKHVYLPEKNGYKTKLEAHDSSEKFNLHPKVPVHWFDPGIYSDRGFLIERGVYFRQLRQHDYDPMPDKVDSSIDMDYSDNRLQVNLGTGRQTTVYLRTKFSMDVMDADDPLVHTLDLPDPAKI